MKVLMLVYRLNVGGTETYILSLAKQLLKTGVEVGVSTEGGPLVPLFRNSGIQVHLIPPSQRGRPVPFLQRLAGTHGYRIVHAHDSASFGWISGWSAAVNRPRFIMTLHGKYHQRKPLLLAAKLAESVVASSPQMVEWAKKLGIEPRKTILAPNGIDTGLFKPDSRQRQWKKLWNAEASYPVIAYAGRFQAPKHLVAEKVIGAAGKILQMYPNSRFILTGPGSHLSALRRSAAGLHRKYGPERLIVRSALHDIRRLYLAADLVIGTGRVALEAMACGKPVLAVGVSGYSGPVTPQSWQRSVSIHFGDHGTIAPATPGLIASGMLDMLKQPKRLSQLGAFGRKAVADRFSVVTMAQIMKLIYRGRRDTPENT